MTRGEPRAPLPLACALFLVSGTGALVVETTATTLAAGSGETADTAPL